MRNLLLLLVLVVCVLPSAWALCTPCDDGNGIVGDGCSDSCVEAGYICGVDSTSPYSVCTLSPGGIARGNTADAALLFQSNFNYGIFDISKTDGSQNVFTLTNYDVSKCSQGTGAKSGYCTFAADGYISTSLPPGPTDNTRTLCAWLYPTTSIATQYAAHFGWSDKIIAIGQLTTGEFIVSNGATTIITGSVASANTWYHVCVSYTSGTDSVALYVNGASDGSAAYGSGTVAQALHIGAANGGADLWTGRIFDVRIVSTGTSSIAGIYADSTVANKAAFSKVTRGCGDGVVDPTEDCDDNNFNDNDGCDKFCKLETLYTCIGTPSICYNANEFIAGGPTESQLAFPDGASYSDYRPSGGAFAGSVVATSTSSIDTSKLSWVPSTVLKSRSGQFTYTIHGLTPSGKYKVDFVFAETRFTAVGQRVFKVSVQGEQPAWSPLDIISAAGKINTAIGRSVTIIADNAGAITVSFTDNAIVQALRYTPVSYQVAAFGSADVLTVAGSASGSGVFNPAKGYPSFSIEAYVYATILQDFTVVGKGTEFSLEYDVSGGYFTCTIGGTTLSGTPSLFIAHKWYHVVCTLDASEGTAYIYINGALDSEVAASPYEWTPTTTALTFGTSLVGYLDSVRLWERALTPNEIFANAFSNAHTISYFGLVEEWTFDSPTNAYSAAGTLGGDATAASFPLGTSNWFDHAIPALTVAIDVGSSSVTFDASNKIIFHADNFFTGGEAVVSTSATPIDNADTYLDGILKTTRAGGEFTYNIHGLVPQQSYLLKIELVNPDAEYDMWVQGVKISISDSVAPDYRTNHTYTILADFAGSVNIKFGEGASVAAILLIPQAAPVGSIRFFTAGKAAPAKLSYEDELYTELYSDDIVVYCALQETTQLLNTAPGTAYKSPSTSTPFSIAVSVVDDTTFTVKQLIPGEIYYVQVFFFGVEAGASYTVSSATSSHNTVGLSDTGDEIGSASVIFTEVADVDGELTLTFGSTSGAFYVSAIQILEGPRVHITPESISAGAKTITVAGANFNLLVALGENFLGESSLVVASVEKTPVNVYPYFDYLVFDFTGVTLTAGNVDLALKISDSSDAWLEPATKSFGAIVANPSITASTTTHVASNAQRLVISGSNFYGDIAVWLRSATATSSFDPLTDANVPCEIVSFCADKIVCTPASTLTHGTLHAVLKTFGTTYASVQVGVVISPPTIISVSRVYAESSTLVINGKGFIATPKHEQNTVVISQQTGSRKRSVGGRDLLSTPAPTCTVVSATTTQIVCALSNVVAGPLHVSVGTAGGFSGVQVVTVQQVMPGSCVPPRGSPDATDSSLCNCWSGYAPSSSSFSDCSVNPTCIRAIGDASSSGPSMSEPTTSFSADKLVIKQTSPIVSNRRDTTVRFSVPTGIVGGHTPITALAGAPGSVSCGYPGNLWVKTIDAAECFDVYTAYIPWSAHTLCGFVQLDSNTTHAYFQTQMDTTYISAYLVNGAYIQRVTTDSYIVSVSFAKTLSFKTVFNTEFAESTANDFVNVLVDATSFEPSSRILTVYLTVETTWPYMIDAAQFVAGAYTPASSAIDVVASDVSANLTGNADSVISDVISCSTTTNTVCGQMLIAKILITNSSVCDIAGGYKFDNTPLLCRDVNLGAACPGAQPSTNLYFEIADTNLCSGDAIDPSSTMIPTLASYTSEKLTKAQTTFYSNDFIYFTYSITSPFATVDSVSLAKLEVTNPDSGTDLIYDASGGLPYLQIYSIAFVEHDNTSITPPGQAITISFGFMLAPSGLVDTLGYLRDQGEPSAPLTIRVAANIVFHGNTPSRKRSLSISEFDETTTTTVSASHNIHFFHAERPPELMNNPQSEYEQPQNAINNEVPSKSIWADLLNEQSTQNAELDGWFDIVESGADTILVKSLVIFLGCLLVHIFA